MAFKDQTLAFLNKSIFFSPAVHLQVQADVFLRARFPGVPRLTRAMHSSSLWRELALQAPEPWCRDARTHRPAASRTRGPTSSASKKNVCLKPITKPNRRKGETNQSICTCTRFHHPPAQPRSAGSRQLVKLLGQRCKNTTCRYGSVSSSNAPPGCSDQRLLPQPSPWLLNSLLMATGIPLHRQNLHCI